MTKIEKARAWLLARVGNPYLMGGTGQCCTVSYRRARAAQYPGSASKIAANCQRMNGSADSCRGCRYYDETAQTGKRAYDCAQLTRWCMEAVGIKLVSGAASQWSKTDWARRGAIDTLPRDRFCLVFRQDAPGKMGHVGAWLGDGTAVHAKGHDWGVCRDSLEDYGNWTHWGVPRGLEEEKEDDMESEYGTYIVTGTRLALREGPGAQYAVLTRLAKDSRARALSEAEGNWLRVEAAGAVGYCMRKYLDGPQQPEAAGEADTAPDTVSLSLDRPTALTLQQALQRGIGGAG